MKRRALVTGISGQDGAYLARYLLRNGYEVFGVARRSSSVEDPLERLHRLGVRSEEVTLIHGDLTDQSSLIRAIELAEPREIYNLAAQSFVGLSWQQPLLTVDITGTGALRLLEATRHAAPQARFYQASSSEMFGSTPAPQNETTIFHPRSPYGIAKVLAHHTAVNYRESYGMFVACGILFNHESPIRGTEFVTRKVTLAAARIAAGQQNTLELGNTNAIRDWGHAEDYVRAMHMMLQTDEPDDYVVATNECHSVQELVEVAFKAAGVSLDRVSSVQTLNRPAEVKELRGDYSKITRKLGWKPEIKFAELVSQMVAADKRFVKGDLLI